MQVKLTQDADTTSGRKKAGEIIDHPDAWLLVQLGIAEPEDNAAREKVEQQNKIRAARQQVVNQDRERKQAAQREADKKAEAKRLADFEARLRAPEEPKTETKQPAKKG